MTDPHAGQEVHPSSHKPLDLNPENKADQGNKQTFDRSGLVSRGQVKNQSVPNMMMEEVITQICQFNTSPAVGPQGTSILLDVVQEQWLSTCGSQPDQSHTLDILHLTYLHYDL